MSKKNLSIFVEIIKIYRDHLVVIVALENVSKLISFDSKKYNT